MRPLLALSWAAFGLLLVYHPLFVCSVLYLYFFSGVLALLFNDQSESYLVKYALCIALVSYLSTCWLSLLISRLLYALSAFFILLYACKVYSTASLFSDTPQPEQV